MSLFSPSISSASFFSFVGLRQQKSHTALSWQKPGDLCWLRELWAGASSPSVTLWLLWSLMFFTVLTWQKGPWAGAVSSHCGQSQLFWRCLTSRSSCRPFEETNWYLMSASTLPWNGGDCCHSSSLAVGVWDKWNLDHSVKYNKGVASLFNDAANLFKNGRVFYDFYKCPVLWCHQLWKVLMLKGVLSREWQQDCTL